MSAKQNALKITEEHAVDPLRQEISLCHADRAARVEAISAAKNAVARLEQVVSKLEDKLVSANIRAEAERTNYIGHVTEVARVRPVETMPLTPARKARAEIAEEASGAREALEATKARYAEAEADLIAATRRIDSAISSLFASDLERRIAAAERVSDQFLRDCNVLNEMTTGLEGVDERLTSRLGRLKNTASDLQMSGSFYDADYVNKGAAAWKAARQALRDDCNAHLPPD
jgi:uncharacterized protein YhaN